MKEALVGPFGHCGGPISILGSQFRGCTRLKGTQDVSNPHEEGSVATESQDANKERRDREALINTRIFAGF